MQATHMILGVLALSLACDGQPPTPDATAQAPASASSAAAPQPRAIDWATIADAALARAERPGAVVVIDLDTGAVVATAERPGQSLHPATEPRSPGSVVKPFLALAAIHEGLATPSETIDCAGPRELGGRTLTCFDDHGPLALAQAMTTSCNHHAFELAERLGLDRIHAHFEAFGFGQKLGEVPDASSPGAVAAAVGTGHGALTISPVQIARAYAALATGQAPPDHVGAWPYTEAELDTVRAAMHGVVNSEAGTGSPAAVPGLTIIGKTGTTELGEGEDRLGLSWFAAWAPAEHPRVVVVVQLEGPGSGGETAAPVAGQVLAALADAP